MTFPASNERVGYSRRGPLRGPSRSSCRNHEVASGGRDSKLWISSRPSASEGPPTLTSTPLPQPGLSSQTWLPGQPLSGAQPHAVWPLLPWPLAPSLAWGCGVPAGNYPVEAKGWGLGPPLLCPAQVLPLPGQLWPRGPGFPGSAPPSLCSSLLPPPSVDRSHCQARLLPGRASAPPAAREAGVQSQPALFGGHLRRGPGKPLIPVHCSAGWKPVCWPAPVRVARDKGRGWWR